MSSTEQFSTEINLVETLISQINDSYLSLQSQFSQTLQSSLSKIQSSFRTRSADLDSKELRLKGLQNLIDERQKELELRENELNSAKKKFFCNRCKTLGFNVGDTGNLEVDIAEEGQNEGNGGESGIIRFSVAMNGRTLQMFLNDKVSEHEIIGNEVYCALKLSNDPAKLVLDAMEGFFPPCLEKGGVEYGGSVVRSTCVLLLEQLMRLKSKIKKAVWEEAKGLACEWREKMWEEKEGRDVVVVGFLLVVVVYGLVAEFDKDELRRLCEVVCQHRLLGKIRSRLGFIGLKVNSLPTCSEVSSASLQAKKEQPDNLSKNDIKSNNYNDIQHRSPTLLSPSPGSQKVQMCSTSPHFDLKTNGGTLNLLNPIKSNYYNHLHPHPPTLYSPLSGSPKVQLCSASPLSDQKAITGTAKLQNPIKSNYYNHLHHCPSTLFSPSQVSPYDQMCSAFPNFDLKTQTPHMKKAIKNSSSAYFLYLCSLCKKMDTNGLKSYLVEHVEELNSLHDEILSSLQCALEPALLVLKVVGVLYQESVDTEVGLYQTCCNYLLDLLLKLSPDMSATVKDDSIIFASIWKARLAKEGNKPSHVLGFLKFLAAYKLASFYEADELLSLFSTFYSGDDVYEPEQNLMLCRALSLETKIPDVIQSLIQENRRLEAVRYICTFKLVDRFPPVPLLKAHLGYTEGSTLKKCKSFKDLNKRATGLILALQGVIRCVINFNLEYQFSPIDLQLRIRRLEKEKEERKFLKANMEKTGNKKRPTCFASEPQVLQEQQQAKHPRLSPENSYFGDVSAEKG